MLPLPEYTVPDLDDDPDMHLDACDGCDQCDACDDCEAFKLYCECPPKRYAAPREPDITATDAHLFFERAAAELDAHFGNY